MTAWRPGAESINLVGWRNRRVRPEQTCLCAPGRHTGRPLRDAQ